MNIEQEIIAIKKELNQTRSTNIIVWISLFILILLTACSKPTLPVRPISKFVITDIHIDSINYYQVTDINNIGTRLNRIDGQWFTDTIKHKLWDTLTYR